MKKQNLQAIAEKIAKDLKLDGTVSLAVTTSVSPFWVGNTLVLIASDETTVAERKAIGKAKASKSKVIVVDASSQAVLDLTNFDAEGNDLWSIGQAESEKSPTSEIDVDDPFVGISPKVYSVCGGPVVGTERMVDEPAETRTRCGGYQGGYGHC